jgi:hypothetical protein
MMDQWLRSELGRQNAATMTTQQLDTAQKFLPQTVRSIRKLDSLNHALKKEPSEIPVGTLKEMRRIERT